MQEPLLTVIKRNAKIVVPIAIVQSVFYFLLNHYPVVESRTLPLTFIDAWTPFWPWTVWPYLMLVSGQVVLALLVRDPKIFRETLTAYLPAIAVTLVVFLVYPTRYVRPELPAEGTINAFVYGLLVRVDSPECCCPSGHIVGPTVIAWGVWRDGSLLGRCLPWIMPWLALSILTTKQHYFWDLLAGLALAGASIAWVQRRANAATR
jgi:hypothetical protein